MMSAIEDTLVEDILMVNNIHDSANFKPIDTDPSREG